MLDDVASPYFHVECHRGEFPDSTTTVDDAEFNRVLAEIDPDLEILHTPTRPGIWSVYQVKFRGASPAGDLLVHEMDLPGSPNSGWIEHIRSRQLIRIGDTPQDVDLAKRFWRRCGHTTFVSFDSESSEGLTTPFLGKIAANFQRSGEG